MKKIGVAAVICAVCLAGFCEEAYADSWKSTTITDEGSGVSYTMAWDSYIHGGTGSYFMASVSTQSITARKGLSPSGSVTFLLKCRAKDDRYVYADFSNRIADTNCTQKYTASLKSTYNKVEVPVTLTREATNGHTWGTTWSMVSDSDTKHERECTHPVCIQTDICEAKWTKCENLGNGTHKLTCADGHTVIDNCSGGEATCTEQAICEYCKMPYGSFALNNHKWGSSYTSDSNG